MKFRALAITTILSTSLMLGIAACSMDDSHDSRGNHSSISSDPANHDAHVAAARFIKQINYARLALALNDGDMAEKHISAARELAVIIKREAPAERAAADVKSGVLTYDYGSSYQYFYFPVQTAPISEKQAHNPQWVAKTLKITDAEVVYLTLNLNDNNMHKRLVQADAQIKQGHNEEADATLAGLSREIVTSYMEISEPLDKARDNIALARRFVEEKNYEGARHALKHADDALDVMQGDDYYQPHHDAIVSLRKQVKHLQKAIAKNDPTLMQKADAKMGTWWKELKDWSHD